jgi:hypothetical protein
MKASGKQIAMLQAIAIRKGILGSLALLEWLEFESNLEIKLDRLENLDSDLVSMVKLKLETLPDAD